MQSTRSPTPLPTAPPCSYLAETGGVRAALKFLGPLRARHPGCLPLMLMLGHCHLLNAQARLRFGGMGWGGPARA